MTQEPDLSDCQSRLRELIKTVDAESQPMNEAETRFHVIDQLLTDCLGWSKEEIHVEVHESRNYTDYELGKPRAVIWEAKKEGLTFEFPADEKAKPTVKIESLRSSSEEARKAIDQVQEYCSHRGVQIAVVCNGLQIAAFLAVRLDGQSPFSGKALIFRSLDELDNNFPLAWQMLSRDGIAERRIVRYLTTGQQSLPKKLSAFLSEYPKVRYKSAVQETLRQLSELLILDIVESEELEKDFLENCYCESGALSNYALLSKNILAARYASIFRSDEAISEPVSVKPDKSTAAFTPEILAEAISKRPIILLGDVGVGKTSFTRNLIHHSAHKEFQRAIYIYFDLGRKSALSPDLKATVLQEIERQLLEKYEVDVCEQKFVKGTYASEIHRFRNGVWGYLETEDSSGFQTKLAEYLHGLISTKDQHFRRSLHHLSKARHKQIVICLDNADQRDFDTQQEVFLVSQELASDWAATVFVSVRPGTFHRSKRAGWLSAYPHKVFSISPPRIELVLEKRLRYALEIAEGEKSATVMGQVNLYSDSLVHFLKALLYSLRNNPDVAELLANITGGNVRSAIELTAKFIGSANVDAQKIIDIMEKEGEYVVPLHEFSKAALLGEYAHFDPQTSIALNIFDVTVPTHSDHFVVPILLAALKAEHFDQDKDGFLLTSSVLEILQGCGFLQSQIESAIRRTTNKKLIETSERVTFEEDETGLVGNMPTKLRITSVGAYHLDRWMGTFAYLDAMMIDTPIFDDQVVSEARQRIDSFRIQDRLSRTRSFRAYLIEKWNQLALHPNFFDFTALIECGDDTFQSVQRAIEKHQ